MNSECYDEGLTISITVMWTLDDSGEDDGDSDEESDLEGMEPTTKRCKVA